MNANDVLTAKAYTTQQACVNRILRAWDQASETVREEGAQWYPSNGATLAGIAADNMLEVDTVTAIAAHLSPRTQWSRAIAATATLCAGVIPTGMLRQPVNAAIAALNSDDPLATLKGPKVRAFAANLLGDHDAVTVDVWAARVALGPRDNQDKVITRAGVYNALAHCYRIAAARVGVTPATMQAATWIVARNGRAN